MMVYFAKCEHCGNIKIGYSSNVKRRMRQISSRTEHTLVLIKAIDGGFSREQELHRYFNDCHVIGEWFFPSSRLLEFIRASKAVEVHTPKKEKPLLSKREVDCIKLLALGKSNSEIAKCLMLKKGTVRNYLYSAMSKLHVENRTQLAVIAVLNIKEIADYAKENIGTLDCVVPTKSALQANEVQND